MYKVNKPVKDGVFLTYIVVLWVVEKILIGLCLCGIVFFWALFSAYGLGSAARAFTSTLTLPVKQEPEIEQELDVTQADTPKINLEDLPVKQLRAMAKGRVSKYWVLKKTELVEAIKSTNGL